jgi:hypothetical protein
VCSIPIGVGEYAYELLPKGKGDLGFDGQGATALAKGSLCRAAPPQSTYCGTEAHISLANV